MDLSTPGRITKLAWSLPWLTRYPFWRASEIVHRITEQTRTQHLIFVVANHFEPSWSPNGQWENLSVQLQRLDEWCASARRIGAVVQDSDATPFRHTNFYPAEQYHHPLIERLAELQSEGLGEVEIHLHHGIHVPDTANNLKQQLEDFRNILAAEHRCLSRWEGKGGPMYAFVHGNLALANSAGGHFCGVDSEMQVLRETGCFADFTLPSAPDRTQVPMLNAIYESGGPLHQARPHRTGKNVRVGGESPKLPLIFTGPLVFNWKRRVYGLPIPRLDDGVLAANYSLDIDRLRRWVSSHVSVRGRPEWVFIKLYCHGFFPFDRDATIGSEVERFWQEVLELSARTGKFKVHFATAREAFNMVMAAIEGREGEPGQYRNYRLHLIMDAQSNPGEEG